MTNDEQIIIMNPKTVKKVDRRDPSLGINIKSGLFSMNAAAMNLVGDCRNFSFVHIKKDRTTYLIPEREGFAFREDKGGKYLGMNFKALALEIMKANEATGNMKFLLAKPVEINTGNDESDIIENAYPMLIKRK